MVRSGFALGCVALLCLGTGCPKDVEDPGFTTGESGTTGAASSSSTGEVDPPDDEDESDSATSTTGPDAASSSSTGTPATTTTDPGTTTGTPATDTGDSGDTMASACGNGTVETGEQCDGADLQNFDCGSLGLGTGAVSCTAMCTFDTSMCMNMGSGTSG